MNWAAILLGAMLVQCAAAGVAYVWAGRPGMGLAFLGYTLANGGLMWDALVAAGRS